MSKKIYLSPSCQSPNVYASGNTNEQEQCNLIAEYAEVALRRCEFKVNRAPKGQSMVENISESNAWCADLHIAIHTNAFNGTLTGGTLAMIYSNNDENRKAGMSILDTVAAISPGPDYTLRTNPELAELNSTKAIAVYLECEFHDTIEGATWIINNVKCIGEAICEGVCNYYDINYTLEETEKMYYVQIGAFKEKQNAENYAQKARNLGFPDTFVKE